MQTLQPTLRLGRDVWDREAMPIDEFHARAGRLRDAMAQRDLDALLLYGSNLNGCGHPTWLSNYIVKLPFAAVVVLPREGDPALIFQGATRGRSAAQATTWIEDVRPCWNVAETCLMVLEDRGLTRSHLGLAAAQRLMPHHEWRALAAGLSSARLADAEDLVDRCRAVKSERELAQIRRASAIVASVLDSVRRLAPSAGEWRLVAEVMREARVRGAEDIRVLIARPADRPPAFRPVEDEWFSDGGLVSVLLSASWERYWSEAIRTFRVNGNRFDAAADPSIHERFQTVVRSLQGGTTTTTQWSRAALAGMRDAEITAVATYGIGHGIGVTPEEWPALADVDVPVATAMCFTVRMPFQSTDGLIWCGDTVVA
jgi:Xaa-Pro aminopeptidase